MNPEKTKFDRFRMVVGTVLAIFGILVLFAASFIFGFTNVPVVVAGILLILGGVLIAGSERLAQMVAELMR